MEVPDYNYLRNLLKSVIKKTGRNIDFFYDWCSQKPNIRKDDLIYTNDYKIKYNGPNEWLNNFKPQINDLNEDENDENKLDDNENNDNKKVINSHNINNSNLNHTHHHHRSESNNLSTKCLDSGGKKYLPFKSLKK